MTDTIESLRARLAEVEGALREAMTTIPSQWGPSDVLTHLLRRAGERDQSVIRAEHAEASAGERALEIARLQTDIDQVVSDRDAALAACAELRAALEHWTHIYSKALSPPGHDTYGEGMRDAKDQVRAILARTDLGRGMVAVPREMVERAQTVVGWYVDNGRGLPHGTRIGEKLLCDLDALLKKGGG